MDTKEEENYQTRSNFIRQLIHNSKSLDRKLYRSSAKIPKKIVQFWDNLAQLPKDVSECITTWKPIEELGFERLLFDKESAGDFIYQKLGLRHKKAFINCYHPAMQSDYFRLCYIFVEGGCYIDADDVYNGAQIQYLFDDDRLKIQPLCYDIESQSMVSPQTFTRVESNVESWIFYFNNNPLISSSGHPIIEAALTQATSLLENLTSDEFPEIQSATGPGNLTKSIYNLVNKHQEIEQTFLVLSDWEDIAINKWDLSYRNDSRNWRLSNGQPFKHQ